MIHRGSTRMETRLRPAPSWNRAASERLADHEEGCIILDLELLRTHAQIFLLAPVFFARCVLCFESVASR